MAGMVRISGWKLCESASVRRGDFWRREFADADGLVQNARVAFVCSGFVTFVAGFCCEPETGITPKKVCDIF
jgi:hypothetical protein